MLFHPFPCISSKNQAKKKNLETKGVDEKGMKRIIITSWKLYTGVVSIPSFPGDQSTSIETLGITRSCERSRFLVWSSSTWTSLEPGAPLQYRSLISDVTSKPRPRAWIELPRVAERESEVGFSINLMLWGWTIATAIVKGAVFWECYREEKVGPRCHSVVLFLLFSNSQQR